MSVTIRVCQFIELTVNNTNNDRTTEYLFQNYFLNTSFTTSFEGVSKTYKFAPFQVQGTVSSLSGDNDQIQILFPSNAVAVNLVEAGQGNRQSFLKLFTRYVNENGALLDGGPNEFYMGLGATFNEETIELRFSTSLDSAASNFPARTLSQKNVGILPLESQVSLR